jgi:plastocyanin
LIETEKKELKMKIASVISSILVLAAMTGSFQTAEATNYNVNIQNFAYVPAGMHINVGDMITWTNQDAVIHTATSDNGVWNSGNLSQGQSYSFTFTNTGTYPYHCAIHTFMMDTIFVSTQSGTSEPLTAPKVFTLSQNYPNPFNARTIISYTLPREANVQIDIFNILGQKIENLANFWQEAGEHQVAWDATSQSSGVYFYRVSVDDQTRTGRMELLK